MLGGPLPSPITGELCIVGITDIVTTTVNAATYDIAMTTTTYILGALVTPSATLSPLKLLHLRMICGVMIDLEIPAI